MDKHVMQPLLPDRVAPASGPTRSPKDLRYVAAFVAPLCAAVALWYCSRDLGQKRLPEVFHLGSVQLQPTSVPSYNVNRPNVIWNTTSWVGAEYTPSSATNELWWYYFDKYRSEVDFELSQAKRQLGFTVLRMFLHSQLFFADAQRLLSAMEDFLAIADRHHIRAGFVFFDDCWNHQGADVKVECVAVKGRHNGCWMASPQDVERSTVEQFRPYLETIVQRYHADPRVVFWEVFNEPNGSNFTQELLSAAYGWIKGVRPMQPVLSCWDDSPHTDIVDVHRYDPWFPHWTSDVYSNPSKGAVVTEAGARWWQGRMDLGNPLEVIAWLQELSKQNPPAPYVPGVFLNWELMVGKSNTRWAWASPDGSPEPVVPFHGHLFPDGTAVSLTEAAAIRNWTTGRDDFIVFHNFLSPGFNNDSFLSLTPSSPEWILISGSPVHEFVVEAAVWPMSNATMFSLLLKGNGTEHWDVQLDAASRSLSLVRTSPAEPPISLATFNVSSLDCGLVLEAWNILRVAVGPGASFRIWLNNMWLDAFDAQGNKQRIAPRIDVTDPGRPGLDCVSLRCQHDGVRVDYISMLPLSVL